MAANFSICLLDIIRGLCPKCFHYVKELPLSSFELKTSTTESIHAHCSIRTITTQSENEKFFFSSKPNWVENINFLMSQFQAHPLNYAIYCKLYTLYFILYCCGAIVEQIVGDLFLFEVSIWKWMWHSFVHFAIFIFGKVKWYRLPSDKFTLTLTRSHVF